MWARVERTIMVSNGGSARGPHAWCWPKGLQPLGLIVITEVLVYLFICTSIYIFFILTIFLMYKYSFQPRHIQSMLVQEFTHFFYSYCDVILYHWPLLFLGFLHKFCQRFKSTWCNSCMNQGSMSCCVGAKISPAWLSIIEMNLVCCLTRK